VFLPLVIAAAQGGREQGSIASLPLGDHHEPPASGDSVVTMNRPPPYTPLWGGHHPGR
jgi:hypothetical protein